MIPNLFSKEPLPDNIPAGMTAAIRKIKQAHPGKEDFLRASYLFLATKYQLKRLQVISKFYQLFIKDLDWAWNKKGHIHCTTLNFLLRIMLVKSGLFKDSDITIRLTSTWFTMAHQYLTIRISDDKSIDVDISMRDYGIPFGSHAGGFRCGSGFAKNTDFRFVRRGVMLFLLFAFIGWAICAAAMGLGMAYLGLRSALLLHAIIGPLAFSLLSYVYFKKYADTTPFETAFLFLLFVMIVDFLLVALVINKSLDIFREPLATWIPFGLIFLSVFLTGLLSKKSG
ncbi:hypothetical protein JW711_05850 [Candidatus Woesearchaeota archaeon]|nr:hypothetical protein [Candidatus Woesearchaeota archaeon]